MCGITGYFDTTQSAETLNPKIKKMTDLILHRGPDGEGYYVKNGIALGHRRLSIIDLAAGAQPMSNSDGTAWIIFNGEIYNFPELREQLLKSNYPFRTHSDTEVIIALYEKYGTELLQKINGMFAFAIWDEPRKRLFIARDRLGKKPLFYYWDNQRLIFGSEMKSILAEPEVSREVSESSVNMFFNFGFIPAPHSIFKNIKKIMPGHYAICSEGYFSQHKYWDVNFQPVEQADKAKLENELYELLYNAVKRRLISDVPLGAFLSGGIDSSSVVGLMSIVNEKPVETFTIGFEEGDYSEAEDARFIAENFKTNHQEMVVKPSSVGILRDTVWHFDEPFGDSSAIPTYYVSQMARKYVTVILSGDGGDEMFAGYTRYQRMEKMSVYDKWPDWLKNKVVGPLGNMLPLNFPAKNRLMAIANNGEFGLGIYPYIKPKIFSQDLIESFEKNPLTRFHFPQIEQYDHLHPLSQRQYLDIKLYLPDDILMKVDKMSMKHSLETRAPLLDYTIAEFAAKLPPEFHIRNGEGKDFLKNVVSRFLPNEIFNKPKHGFSIPKKLWFKKELKDFSHDVLLSSKAGSRPYFNRQMVEKVLNTHSSNEKDYSKWIWCLLNFELWHNLFIDSDSRKI